MNLCDDNRIITIEKAKQALIKGTNIEDSPEEMKVLDNILFRCWQMGWLDRYDPQMPSNTSNALEALDSVNATQFNALDSISRQAAINALERTKRIASYELHGGEVLRTFNVVLNSLINIMSLLPPANNSEIPNSSDTISRQAVIDLLKQMRKDGSMVPWEGKNVFARIRKMPSAQPDIIRCRNCKFASGDSRICMKFGHSPIGELDFCAWAERRTDG